jgi:hypothetical protein
MAADGSWYSALMPRMRTEQVLPPDAPAGRRYWLRADRFLD